MDTAPRARIALLLAAASLAAGGGVLSAGCGRHARGQTPAAAAGPPPGVETTADELWRRSNVAARTIPMRATVTITRWFSPITTRATEAPETTVIDVVAGDGGRYRHTYLAPEGAKGRLVVSDGTTVWQYEPRKQTVLRRKITLPDPLEDEETALASEGVPHRIESGESPVVAGRPTRVVAQLYPAGVAAGQADAVRERRWLDTTTGRSLRTEDYAPDGRLLRRVEMGDVQLPSGVGDAEFQPAFPDTAWVVPVSTHEPEAPTEAARLRLPRRAGRFKLQRVLRPKAASTGTAAESRTTQLLYTDGARALSVFVAESLGPDGREASLQPGGGWRSVALGEGRGGFAREGISGNRTALVWTAANHRYTAMGKVPLPELLPVVRALAGR